MPWLEKLRELKATKNVSSKQIAAGTFQPERTISRIFSGETENPTITVLIPIINFLGGSWDDIFADTAAVVGSKNLVAMQEDFNAVTAERDSCIAENVTLKEKVATLTTENELLKLQLTHKEELLALHNYYNKLNPVK